MKVNFLLIFFILLLLSIEIDFSIIYKNSEIIRPIVLFFMLIISFLLLNIKNRFKFDFNKNYFIIFFSIYLTYIVMQFLFTPSFEGKINSLFGLVVCFVFSLQVSHKFKYSNFIRSFVHAVLFLTIISWVLFLFIPNYVLNPEEFFRFKGVFLHSQRFSMVLSVAIIFLFLADTWFNKYFRYLILIIFIGTLFATKTRANISFVIIIIIFRILEDNKKYILPFIVSISFLVISYFLLNFSFLDIYQRGDGEISDLSGRTYLWSQILEKVPDKLFFGYGFGFFKTAPFTVFSWIPYQAHNLWLMVLYETGVFGLILFHFFFITSFIISLKFKQKYKTSFLFYFLIFIFFSSLTGVLIGGLVTPFYFIFIIITIYERWFSFGLKLVK